MDIKEMGRDNVKLTQVAQDRVQWQTLVNLQVP